MLPGLLVVMRNINDSHGAIEDERSCDFVIVNIVSPHFNLNNHVEILSKYHWVSIVAVLGSKVLTVKLSQDAFYAFVLLFFAH